MMSEIQRLNALALDAGDVVARDTCAQPIRGHMGLHSPQTTTISRSEMGHFEFHESYGLKCPVEWLQSEDWDP